MANEVKVIVTAQDKASKTLGDIKASTAALTAVALKMGSVLVKGIGYSIQKASDLNETMSKANVVFGKNYQSVVKWANGAAKGMGLSKQAALESAASFGDMFKQLGNTGNQSTVMSKKV